MSAPLTAHFDDDELWCRHCRQFRFHPGFLDALEALRTRLGEPMRVTSGARCRAHNDSEDVRGHARSLHVFDDVAYPAAGQEGALAADVATPDGAYRGRLFAAAWGLGWSVGWNSPKRFLHLDRRDRVGLPQATFDY